MVMIKRDILNSLLSLHYWREKYNGEAIGFGYDEYKLDEKFHYADAYALWGHGYLKLLQITQQKEFLNLAKECANWLIKNKTSRYKNFSWGLPWEWDGRSRDFSYITTSTFAGNFFIYIYTITKDEEYLNVAKSIGDWVIKENGFKEESEGIWFFYSDHPSLHYPIVNAISMTSGFFSKLCLHTLNIYYKKLAAESARCVINNQNDDGSWNYSTKSAIIDNIHTSLTLEGLWEYYDNIADKGIFKPLIEGTDYLWNKFYEDNGYGKEHISCRYRDDDKIYLSRIINGIIEKAIELLKNKNSETRLWGYAASIRAFVYASYADLCYLDYAIKIFSYVKDNLQDGEGYFYYRSNDRSCYIRHQAHIFDALGLLAVRLRDLEVVK